jgi:hypothetical protein
MQSDHHGRLTTWCEPANSSSSQAGRQQTAGRRQHPPTSTSYDAFNSCWLAERKEAVHSTSLSAWATAHCV